MTTTDDEAIRQRKMAMPSSYRGIYKRAMTGKSRKASMQAFCLECMGWLRVEVARCTAPACPLYPYRPAYADQDAATDAATAALAAPGATSEAEA